MTPLEAMIYILGPIAIAAAVYHLFLIRELDKLEAESRKNPPAE